MLFNCLFIAAPDIWDSVVRYTKMYEMAEKQVYLLHVKCKQTLSQH